MTMTYVVKDQFVGKHSVECIYMQAENISRRIVTSPITLKRISPFQMITNCIICIHTLSNNIV